VSYLFPIGHYLGVQHSAPAAGAGRHRLRLGTAIAYLDSDAEFGIWALAHSRPRRDDPGQPWGRAGVTVQARRLAIEAPGRLIDVLLARGVLAEVPPGGAGAERFARTHRLLPLRSGLGQVPGDPLSTDPDAIGLPANVAISRRQFRLWQWGRLAANLWDLCRAFTTVQYDPAGLPGQQPAGDDPRELLEQILTDLHVLLAVNAAYLDLSPVSSHVSP
jgi:hypothetical protein